MVDAGIGRLLVASLHQGIADMAPARLPFYENWLTPPGLRDGKFGLAALHAVLSFLRLEGQNQYEQIMARAGEYTADWGYAELSSFERNAVRRLPPALRARVALYLIRRLVKSTFRGSRASTRLRKGSGTVQIRGSIFCEVRATADWHMCVFYAAAMEAVSPALRSGCGGERQSMPGIRRQWMHHDRHDSRSAGRSRGRRGCVTRLAALCAACAVLITATAAAAESSEQTAAPETLVMPFDNPGNTLTLQWLGEGSAALLSEFLERYGGLAVPREERLAAFDRLQLPPAAALSHATMIKVGQIVGATEVVIGTYHLVGEELTVKARVIRLDTWHLAPEVVERGALTDVFRVYDAIARQLRGAKAAAPAPAAGTLLTSLNAFEWYVKGMVVEPAAAQRSYLEQAAKAAPSDDRVKLALWRVHTEAGDHQSALGVAASVAPSSLLSSSARYLMARSQIELRRYDEAFKTLEALHRETRLAEVAECARGRAAATRWNAADRTRGVLLQPGDADRPGRRRLLLQSGLRLLARQGPAGRRLLAARSGPARSG